jgi:hypothetical protein
MSEAMSDDFYKPSEEVYYDLPAEIADPVIEYDRVSFLSTAENEPDYDYLSNMAQSADSGPTLLVYMLTQTGQIEPLDVIANYKNQFMYNQSKLDTLRLKEMSVQLSAEEANEIKILDKEADTINPILAKWNDVEGRIKQAKDYYDSVIIGPRNGNRNTNLLEALYDDSQEYDDSGLIVIIKNLRLKIPKPRQHAGGRVQANPALNNVVEAERLIRLLILEETNQLSFD